MAIPEIDKTSIIKALIILIITASIAYSITLIK